MKNTIAQIRSNEQLAAETYEMVLDMPAGSEQVRPGQFINIQIAGQYLRRPISICDWTEDSLTIIYKTVGKATGKMSRMQKGERLDILWPLGNGYDLDGFKQPLLIGGGAGVPPMYGLCRKFTEEGRNPRVILGFRSSADVFYEARFAALGADVIVTTEDGSKGQKGFVTDAMETLQEGGKPAYDSLFACGPEAMLRAIDEKAPKQIPGQMSFERRMGCGFGACMGCSCKTKYGSKRICVDGPVLERSEIIW